MNQNEFNPIGIDSQLDWPRIRKLLSIGLFAAILTLIGDMMIGWGIQDETKKGLVRMFSAYRHAQHIICSGTAWNVRYISGRPVLLWNLSSYGRKVTEAST